MALYSQVLPECISNNLEVAVRFIADQAFSQAGQRYFNLYDAQPLREYVLAYPPQDPAEVEELRAFFLAVRGLDPFLIKDWSDFEATQQNTSLTLITGSVYQMNRIYVAPSRTAVRPIYKPKTGALIFRTRSGVTTDITGTSSIDFATGRVTVASHAGGDTYAWSGEFYVPVYFSDPQAVFRVLSGSASRLVEWPDITLRESREIT